MEKAMSKMMICSDLHLGHVNICKFREGFSSAEEHHEVMFDKLASNISKRDTLYLLGDVAFTPEWNAKIGEIKCAHKLLVLGNHDTDTKVSIQDLMSVYDNIVSLIGKRNMWFSHMPIHPREFYRKEFNLHGHVHQKSILDPRYINVSVDVLPEMKPISFQKLLTSHREKYEKELRNN